MRVFALIGGLYGFLGVAMGAFGAHALKESLSTEMLSIYQTGAQYQLIHAVVLAALGLSSVDGRLLRLSGWLFAAGTLVFSGSLYALALTQVNILGAITPIGGVCFLAGWVALAIGASRRDPK